MIFAWWGIRRREPQWDLHPDSPDQTGWSNVRIQTLRFPGHPQDTTENSVDLGHLRYVHGYDNVDRIGQVLIDGPLLQSDFDFKRVRRVARIARFNLDISASTKIFGLGYSYVEIREHSIGMDMRLWVLATPVDGTLIDLSLVSQAREIRSPKRWFAGLGFLPVRWRAPLVNRFIAGFQRKDVLQDVIIWSNKRYKPKPRLCLSDGEIIPFRTYCEQFYSGYKDSERPFPVTSEGSV